MIIFWRWDVENSGKLPPCRCLVVLCVWGTVRGWAGSSGCYQTCRSCRQRRRNHLQGFNENILEIVSWLSSGRGEAAVAAGTAWDVSKHLQLLEGVLAELWVTAQPEALGHSQALGKGKHSPGRAGQGSPSPLSQLQPCLTLRVSPVCPFTQQLPCKAQSTGVTELSPA